MSTLSLIHISIEHGFYLTDEIIELMLKNDVFLVPTLCAVHHIVVQGTEAGIPEYGVAKAREAQKAHVESFLKAYKAGVKIAMGTDAAVSYTHLDVYKRQQMRRRLSITMAITLWNWNSWLMRV